MAVETFKCNASDPETVVSQVTKLKQRFKLSRMVIVGDYGCIQVGLLIAVSENWVTTMFVRPGEHAAYRELACRTTNTRHVPGNHDESNTRSHDRSNTRSVEASSGDEWANEPPILTRSSSVQSREELPSPLFASVIEAELVEITIPHRPHSSKQKYPLTGKSREFWTPWVDWQRPELPTSTPCCLKKSIRLELIGMSIWMPRLPVRSSRTAPPSVRVDVWYWPTDGSIGNGPGETSSPIFWHSRTDCRYRSPCCGSAGTRVENSSTPPLSSLR